MEFRLTYSGLLLSTANDSGSKALRRAEHKHAVRMAFHPQLKRLWNVTPFLERGMTSGPYEAEVGSWKDGDVQPHAVATLSRRFDMFTWNFVPLVTSNLDLMCSIEVLFLRPNRPGGIISQGDIDGRLKTLIDALAIPDANQGYESRKAAKGENPIFVLLENDRQITNVSVETDQLLEYVTPNQDVNEVRLVITVKIRPYEVHAGNLPFV